MCKLSACIFLLNSTELEIFYLSCNLYFTQYDANNNVHAYHDHDAYELEYPVRTCTAHAQSIETKKERKKEASFSDDSSDEHYPFCSTLKPITERESVIQKIVAVPFEEIFDKWGV
ncbi:hypothetical protein RIF29_04359 [Crotalaria pallida]|uniref:Uncharacterized protein n=1 Tax=Crotalaria pallida TaxID=3830 RepID=A0AAN9J0Y0_CROPI